MSSIQLCAAHQATSGFDGDAIAQYMRTDFITLQEHLSVHEAREHFISQLASDDIPGQVFVVAGKKLRGSLSVKKLLQETDINQSIRHLMDSCLFRVKPDDERQQVIAELSERGLDLVPVVDKGELVGCLMEKEIAHLLEDDVTEDAQLQGATLPLEKPYLEISPWTLWKKRSVWLLLLFVAEAYTPAYCSISKKPGIGHRAGLLYSAAHRHRRQQRNADHLDAGALDGAGGSATARYGAGDPQRGIDLVSDCPDPGPGGLPARLDDGDWHGNHAHRQPDAGVHYPVERDCLLGHSDGA